MTLDSPLTPLTNPHLPLELVLHIFRRCPQQTRGRLLRACQAYHAFMGTELYSTQIILRDPAQAAQFNAAFRCDPFRLKLVKHVEFHLRWRVNSPLTEAATAMASVLTSCTLSYLRCRIHDDDTEQLVWSSLWNAPSRTLSIDLGSHTPADTDTPPTYTQWVGFNAYALQTILYTLGPTTDVLAIRGGYFPAHITFPPLPKLSILQCADTDAVAYLPATSPLTKVYLLQPRDVPALYTFIRTLPPSVVELQCNWGDNPPAFPEWHAPRENRFLFYEFDVPVIDLGVLAREFTEALEGYGGGGVLTLSVKSEDEDAEEVVAEAARAAGKFVQVLV
ncbi:uncharacterized protein EV422DRAFT_279881 [Fimicolochytrium jonesii]|uniref:uncharacterized protein n=1 Tax=Fimicolochytrium jonesii TaxID=1396493 RepID=UPI0022FF08A4|nr:uncharacterized protein EV422DRAFT_279881 [Fimicolochytrium jonesii]KAI8816586.1 hypothetical protein EV422DRAFT_279881 [Fimicolochytrium jonesii]